MGVTAPSGVAKSVDGGFLVDGRWGWGSGAVHADWVCGGCVVHDENNEKRLSSSGSPEVWLMIFSKDQIKIEDTWQVSGMKGTGSNHFSVKNAFVPKGRQVLLGTPKKLCTTIQVSYAWTFGFGSVFGKFRYRLSGTRGL